MEPHARGAAPTAPKSANIGKLSKAGLAATFIVGVLYFAFIVGAPLAPAFFAQPIGDGGLLSMGMIFGIALIVIIVALAAIYTISRDDNPV